MPFGGFGGFLHGCQLELMVAKGGSDMMVCWLCSLVADDGLKEYKGITNLFSQYSSPCGQFSWIVVVEVPVVVEFCCRPKRGRLGQSIRDGALLVRALSAFCSPEPITGLQCTCKRVLALIEF
jgi:hypothetical protein